MHQRSARMNYLCWPITTAFFSRYVVFLRAALVAFDVREIRMVETYMIRQ